jgi:hypothetical protein
VRGYCLCTFGCFLTRQADKTRAPADIAAASSSADALVAYRAELVRRLADTYYTDHVYWLFEVGHLDTLIADIRRKLAF